MYWQRLLFFIIGTVFKKPFGKFVFEWFLNKFIHISGVELSNGIISNLRGGLPLLTKEGRHIGSVGVSGAPQGEIDEDLAKIAADKIGSGKPEVC